MMMYLTLCLLLLLLPFTAFSEQKIYTNTDLKKYSYKSSNEDDKPKPKNIYQLETEQMLYEMEIKKQQDELRQKRYWCDLGEMYRKDIKYWQGVVDEAKEDLKKKKEALFWTGPDIRYSFKKIEYESAKEYLAWAEKQLQRAQKSYDDLEMKAYRQGIPPGWLRCQFE